MADKLTPKQETFAQKWVELGNASEAYRQAFEVTKENSEWVKVEASRLLAAPNVALTVINLQEAHQQRHNVTVDSLTKELDEARLMATAEKQAAAMTGATMGKAKLHGLITDKNEHSGKGGGAIEVVTRIEQVIVDPNTASTDS